MKSALDNPMVIDGIQGSMEPRLSGVKSTKSFSKMGDGLSQKSVHEPAIMLSARKPTVPLHPQSSMEIRSRSSAQMKTFDDRGGRKTEMGTPNLI